VGGIKEKGGALAAWRGEACEAPSEAKPVRQRRRSRNALIELISVRNLVVGLVQKLNKWSA
jgi:hypothetical protein